MKPDRICIMKDSIRRAPSLFKTSFWKDDSGSILPIFAIAGVLIVSAGGAGVDMSRAVLAKQGLQNALDSAVLAGATYQDGSKTVKASQYFSANYNPRVAANVESNFADADNVISGHADVQLQTYFLSVAGVDTLSVAADSAAKYTVEETAAPCIMVMDEDGNPGFKANGSGTINAPECEMHVHSQTNNAVYVDSTRLDLDSMCVAGKVSGNARNSYDNLNSYCSVDPDPFESSMPKVSHNVVQQQACMHSSNWPSSNGNNITMRFKPGTYCSFPNINGNVAKVIFEPGNYYFKALNTFNSASVEFGDGNYVFDNVTAQFNGSVHNVTMGAGLYVLKNGGTIRFDNQTVKGDGVSIYLDDTQSKFITAQGNTKATLTAPTSGTYANLLMFEKVGLSGGKWDQYNLDGTLNIEGLVYLPSRNLHFNGNGYMNGANLSLVLHRLTLDGKITIEEGVGSSSSNESVNAYLLR